MKLNKSIPFAYEGKNYEIHIFSDGWKFQVKAYLGEQPANGYSYSIDLPTAFDLQTVIDTDAIQTLVNIAKEDIISNRWEKYVRDYLQNIQIPEGGLLGCQNCSKREISSQIVNGRKMYECKSCGNIWYKKETSGRILDIILDQIIDGVEKNGSYEEAAVSLLNTVFNEKDKEGLSFIDQVKSWAKQNKLEYERFTGKDARGKNEEMIRFYSKVPRIPPPFRT
jgi:phosphoribosyl-AMP cyclohydrolase